MDFIAQSTSSFVQFTALIGGAAGNLLDAVDVEYIAPPAGVSGTVAPLPSTASSAMPLLAGFALLKLRKKRTTV